MQRLKHNEPTMVVTIRMPAKAYHRLARLAKLEGVSVGAWCRTAIMAYCLLRSVEHGSE